MNLHDSQWMKTAIDLAGPCVVLAVVLYCGFHSLSERAKERNRARLRTSGVEEQEAVLLRADRCNREQSERLLCTLEANSATSVGRDVA
jgi:hypothetical protein